jgi:hypothetical protein
VRHENINTPQQKTNCWSWCVNCSWKMSTSSSSSFDTDDENQTFLLKGRHESYESEEEDDKIDKDYSNTLPCEKKKIFGFFSVKPEIYGLFRIICDVIGTLIFTLSITSRKPQYLFFIFQYVFWCYCVAPFWQNYQFYSIETKKALSDPHGCILGYLFISLYGFLLSDHLDIRSRASTDPRYIPLSLYNDLYLITHPGQELNPNFPKKMKNFGVARIFLLIYSASAKASYNLIVFYNAFHVYSNDHDFFTRFIALIALVIALSDLRIYLLTSVFGALFNPYMLLLTCSLFLPMCSFLLNPSQENPIFVILEFYWRLIVQCS